MIGCLFGATLAASTVMEYAALIPVSPKTWLDWALEHQAAKIAAGRRSSGKRSSTVQPGQLSIWSNLKGDKPNQ
jgi:hypothetical protein